MLTDKPHAHKIKLLKEKEEIHMAKKECKQNMNMAGENDQVEKMSFDELTSVTGGAVGSENAEDARPVNSRGAMVAKYGQLTKLLQKDDVPNRGKLLQELHEVQKALQRG